MLLTAADLSSALASWANDLAQQPVQGAGGLSLQALWNKLIEWLPRLMMALVIFAIGWFLIGFIQKFIRSALRHSKIDPILHAFILSTTRISMIVLLGITCMGTMEIETTSLVTALGAVGLAISLAIKDSLANLAGGIQVLLTKPFSLGDYIESSGFAGTVSEINLSHTMLKTVDNKRIYVPNGDMAKAQITNFSAEPTRRLDLIFSVGYEDDFEKAKDVIRQVVESSPLALTDPAPFIRVTEHAASSINIVCRVWVKSENYWELSFFLKEEVKHAFDREGINIPYNQLDLHLLQK